MPKIPALFPSRSFICGDCHRSDIHLRAWINPNTNEHVRDIDCDGKAYCTVCEDEVTMLRMEAVAVLFNLEEEVMCKWSIEEVLEEINRDRSDSWTDYTEEDWQEGWDEWCEGDIYKLLMVKMEVVK